MADFSNLKPGSYNPTPGSPLDASKYPRPIGPNGQHYGTQPGYIYNPYTDRYDPDPKAIKDYQKANGLAPVQPSIWDTIGPAAAVGGSIAGAQAIAKNPSEAIKGVFGGIKDAGNTVGGWLGGDSAPAAVSEASSASTPGTFGLGDLTGLDPGAASGQISDAVGAGAPEASGTFGGLSGIAGPLALAGIAAYTGSQALKGWDKGSQTGDAWEGAKAGWDATGPLKYVPLLGQAPLIAGALGGLFGHKSTKDFEKERWSDVQSRGIPDAMAAAAANHPDGDTGIWQTGQFAGKKWNFQDAQTLAKADPSQFQLVLGNYQTFGNDWSKYSPDQRNAIVKGVLDAGLYKGDHGDIVITDKEEAQKIKDQVLAGNAGSAVTPQLSQTTQGVTTPPQQSFTPVQPQGTFGGQTPTIGPGPNKTLSTPQQGGYQQGPAGAQFVPPPSGGTFGAPQQQAQPNQWGNTRISPGVYKDAQGNIKYTTTGQ